MKNIRKTIAVLLAIMMLLTAFPAAVFAADDGSTDDGKWEIICEYPPAETNPAESLQESEPICIYPTQPADNEYETARNYLMGLVSDYSMGIVEGVESRGDIYLNYAEFFSEYREASRLLDDRTATTAQLNDSAARLKVAADKLERVSMDKLPDSYGEQLTTANGYPVVYRPSEPSQGKVVRKIGKYIFFVDNTFDTDFGIYRTSKLGNSPAAIEFVPLRKAYDDKLIGDTDLDKIVALMRAQVQIHGFYTAGNWSVMDNAEFCCDNLRDHSKLKNLDWIAKVGEDDNGVLFYAGKGDLTEKGEDFTLFDYKFTDILCPVECHNGACLYYASKKNDGGLYPSYEVKSNSSGYCDFAVAPLVRMIRDAEAKGICFPFTVKHKLGDDAEREINVLYKSKLYPQAVIDCKSFGDFNVLISTSLVMTDAYYDKLIGHYVFSVPGQQPEYDIGVYITKDGVGYTLEGAYDKGVISDEDMDKAAEVFSKYHKVKKLTDEEIKLTEDLISSGVIYRGGFMESDHIISSFWFEKQPELPTRRYGQLELLYIADLYDVGTIPLAKIFFVNGWEIHDYYDGWYVMNDREHDGHYQTLESFVRENFDEDFLLKLPELTGYEAEARKTEGSERAFADYLETFGNSYHSYVFREIGEVGGYMMCYYTLGKPSQFGVDDDEYKIRGKENGFMLCFIRDGKVYTASDVIADGVSVAQMKAVCDKSKAACEFFAFTYIGGEPYEYQTLLDTVNQNTQSYYTRDDLVVKTYERISNGTYLVRYHISTMGYADVLNLTLIDKYVCSCSPMDQPYILRGKSLTTLERAYESGVIGKSELKTVDKLLDSLKENKETVKAGKDHFTPTNFFYKNKNIKSSDSKVVKVNTDGSFTALTKGKATLSYTKSGRTVSMTITVKDNPSLGKSSITVRKGKTKTVKITGKASSVNNAYKNTKYAKITSKTSAKKLTVKGLKKGKTTIKVKVNGKWLSLKVKVV